MTSSYVGRMSSEAIVDWSNEKYLQDGGGYLVVRSSMLVGFGDDIWSKRPENESTERGHVKGRGSLMPCDC
jgi:hypothetical protein